MPAKEGSIRKTFTFEGKRYSVYGETEVDAEIKKREKLKKLEEGSLIVTRSMTVLEWARLCISTYKAGISPGNVKRYRSVINCLLDNKYGRMQVKSFKPINCQQCLNSYRRKDDGGPMAKSSVKRARYFLKFIFEKAVANNLIAKNPAESLTLPEYKETVKRRSLTQGEQDYFKRVTSSSDRFKVFELMYYCGCRPDEAVKVQGCDIQEMGGRHMLHIRGTKTENADRIVPLPGALYEKIKNTPPFAYVATSEAGNYITHSTYSRMLKGLRRAMHIAMGGALYNNAVIAPFPFDPNFVPYWLRHTYCTNLQKAGIDVRVASKLMGHSSIEITADIYTHVDTSSILEAAAVLDAVHPGVLLIS